MNLTQYSSSISYFIVFDVKLKDIQEICPILF